ncbi:hypothetical protein QYE76_025148 [Lolium multiflorum]|uniref:Retrotransposon gag domain-containing protein n=1 Tax=Lolium multiflorum TaxID=4521 RepID=A0AAD8RF84_LOLMU|nr:hypothetical protein QYE76_025148 [Lolium multiflorum]
MAQAHRGALESLAILGNNLVAQKEKTMVQGSGSKHHARDARDEITQSRIDKARRRRATRKDDDSDSSDEDQEYDGELRGADCLSYKIREAMPPKMFKPTPTDAAKYDGQQEPRSWIDDYLQTVILHKGNQIAAMQCLQLYLKDSARAWLRGLPKGSVKSWDDLVDAFVANFQATYKRPVGIEELRSCRQKQKESMRSYIGRFTKLLNAAEDVSVDRAIDAFSDGVQRESYIEELGRKKPKTITKLMEIANSWADGEDNGVGSSLTCTNSSGSGQPTTTTSTAASSPAGSTQRGIPTTTWADEHDPQDRCFKKRDEEAHPRDQFGRKHHGKHPEYVDWSSQSITFSRADHPMTIPKPGHVALVVEAQIGGFKMSKVFMDGGSGLNLIFVDTIRSMGITMSMLEETDTCFHGILPTAPGHSLGKAYLNVIFGRADNFRKEKIEFEVVNWESQYHAILERPAYAKFMAVPHYAYLKLKMPGNNGTNITVYGSFSRSDNCDRDFQRIAAKFGPQREIVGPPPKLSLREIKEEKDGRETKKKPAALALKASAAEASAAKGSAVDGTEGLVDSKTMATTAQTLDETSNAAATTNAVKKPEEEKNPFLA